MKKYPKNYSGFSLTEVIVGVTILILAGISITGSYNFLMNRDKEVDIIVQNIYFHKYVFDITNSLDIPKVPIGNTFYINQTNTNSFEISQDPTHNKNHLGFFYPYLFEKHTEEIITPFFSHEIKVLQHNELYDINYTTYLITTKFFDNEKTSYLTK